MLNAKNSKDPKQSLMRLTQVAFLGMRLSGTPFWCLLCMLTFILYKHLQPTPLQIAVLIALRPASSLLAPYWSQAIYQRPDKIIPNLMGANFFRYLPFLIVPWYSSPWFIIFACGLYMTLTRATVPAWMELFKYNLPSTKRAQMVGYGSTIDFCGTAIVTLGFGFLLDSYPALWGWFFFFAAFLGIASTALLFSLAPPPLYFSLEVEPLAQLFNSAHIRAKFVRPWRQVWELVKQHKDFTLYQGGFMLGGAGLMIMQPALPQLFIDVLDLSFVEMSLAIAFCKGIGVALTSPLWTRLFRKVHIFHLSALVTLFGALFPFLLLATPLHIFLLYIAYAIYGIMQAGSELSWHMSGLVFAGEKESSTFSSTNVLTVGIRGCFIPLLGSLLLPHTQPVGLLYLGALLCFTSSLYFLLCHRLLRDTEIES